MTSKDGFYSPRLDGGCDPQAERKSSGERHVSDEEAATWAMMLSGSLERPQQLSLGLGMATARPTNASGESLMGDEQARLSRGSGTTTRSPGSQLADTPSVNDTGNQRLVLNVDSETLGRVQLIVDRQEGGVRVLVGSDPGAKGTLSSGKHALGEALAAAGVRVHSLRFVTQDEVGIVLAQDRLNKRARDESPKKPQPEDDASRHPRSKKKRNLNLVG